MKISAVLNETMLLNLMIDVYYTLTNSFQVKRFESIMKEYSSVFKSRHVAVTFGNDFTYSVASAWFKNMDKLIKYVSSLILGIVSSP